MEVQYADGGGTVEILSSAAVGPNKASQASLTYGGVTKTYGDAAFTHTASGGSGPGVVTYASSDTSVATINSSTGEVTILKAGTVTLTATKAGAATYAEISTSCTLTANKAALTATVDDYSKTYGDANPAFEVTVSGFVNSETAATAAGYSAPSAVCAADTTTDAGSAVISISGGLATNYTLNTTDTGTLTINPKTLTLSVVTANDKPYDRSTSATGAIMLSGVINGDAVTASGTFTFENAAAGTAKTVNVTGIALSGADKDNYTLATTTATASAAISAKQVTIASVTIADKTYDGSTSASITAASLNGIISGDAVTADFFRRNGGLLRRRRRQRKDGERDGHYPRGRAIRATTACRAAALRDGGAFFRRHGFNACRRSGLRCRRAGNHGDALPARRAARRFTIRRTAIRPRQQRALPGQSPSAPT